MEKDPAVIRSPGTYEQTERSWPLALIAFGLVIWMLDGPTPYLLPYFISDYFDVYQVLTVIIIISPILYVIAIAEMVVMRTAGTSGRTKFSSIGGITLLAGALSGTILLAITLYQLSQVDVGTVFNPLDVIFYVLPIVGVGACLLGAYFAFKRTSFKGAMIAGVLSLLSGGIFFPLALIPIALDAKEFDRKESKGKE